MIEICGVARANEMSGVLSASNSYDVVHLGKVSLIVILIVLILHVLTLKNSKVKQNFCQMVVCYEKSNGENKFR